MNRAGRTGTGGSARIWWAGACRPGRGAGRGRGRGACGRAGRHRLRPRPQAARQDRQDRFAAPAAAAGRWPAAGVLDPAGADPGMPGAAGDLPRPAPRAHRPGAAARSSSTRALRSWASAPCAPGRAWPRTCPRPGSCRSPPPWACSPPSRPAWTRSAGSYSIPPATSPARRCSPRGARPRHATSRRMTGTRPRCPRPAGPGWRRHAPEIQRKRIVRCSSPQHGLPTFRPAPKGDRAQPAATGGTQLV
jgi:hypothetical protein